MPRDRNRSTALFLATLTGPLLGAEPGDLEAGDIGDLYRFSLTLDGFGLH